MKKVINTLFLAIMLMSFTATASFAVKGKEPRKEEISAEDLKRLEEIDARVLEIKEMDFSEMSKSERKEIRNELKELRKEAKDGNGLYISTGALIVILILLIILL